MPKTVDYKKLVMTKESTAVAYDVNGRTCIYTKRNVTVVCDGCGHTHQHLIIDYMRGVVSVGDTEDIAWKNAAKNLGLI